MAVLRGGAVSYERGTPVNHAWIRRGSHGVGGVLVSEIPVCWGTSLIIKRHPPSRTTIGLIGIALL